MEELLTVIDYIPPQWRGILVVGFLLLPRFIQKMKATEDFKFFGELPEILTRAQQQRQQILDKVDLIQGDVALLRKFIKIKFEVTEGDMRNDIKYSQEGRRNKKSVEKGSSQYRS